MTKRWTKLGLGVLFLLLAASGASAQAKKRSGPKVIELEEIRIEGRVQKPNAFYILNRSSLGYEIVDLRASFLKEIVRAARKKPF
jgi:hypothetical protein